MQRAHEQTGIWPVEGLTVCALAQRVKPPEHQARKAINREPGHRTFARCSNNARIGAARARLRTPEASERTMPRIAFEVGFASPGRFNRAFREDAALSPTDDRKQAIDARV